MLRAPMLAAAVQPRGLHPEYQAAGPFQLLLASLEPILLAYGLVSHAELPRLEGGARLRRGIPVNPYAPQKVDPPTSELIRYAIKRGLAD